MTPTDQAVTTTDVPARLDALPWSRFHWLVVTALGVTWILDGLEVTLVGSLSGVLGDPRALNLTPQEIGWSGSAYLVGAIAGALFGFIHSPYFEILGRWQVFAAWLSHPASYWPWPLFGLIITGLTFYGLQLLRSSN